MIYRFNAALVFTATTSTSKINYGINEAVGGEFDMGCFSPSFGSTLRQNNALLNIRHLTVYSGPVPNFSSAEPVSSFPLHVHYSCQRAITTRTRKPCQLYGLQYIALTLSNPMCVRSVPLTWGSSKLCIKHQLLPQRTKALSIWKINQFMLLKEIINIQFQSYGTHKYTTCEMQNLLT
jgi:hypothetical protein